MEKRGKLYFRYGTMGSAKTALLLTTAYNFEERGVSHLCLKPITDTRENNNVIRSRIGIERSCEWVYPETNIYEEITEKLKTDNLPDWILVDEAQFLNKEHVDQLSKLVDDYGINVICYGLRTDFRTELFEGSRRLFEIADTIDEIKSTCSCGRKTSVNARVDSKGDIMTEGAQVEIGGNERYMALCRKCWNERKRQRMMTGSLPL